MERKIVVRKTKHSDFLFGYPYVAEVIGSVLKICDPNFAGDSHIICSTDEFYIQDERHTYKLSDGNEDESVNKCITMSYLLNYGNYIIFRGIYFLSGDGSVDDDSGCYYIYRLGNQNKEMGWFVQYNEQGIKFTSESEAISYTKLLIDRTDSLSDDEVDNCKEIILSDLETFGALFVYIMNVSDMLKIVDADSCVDELAGLDFVLEEVF